MPAKFAAERLARDNLDARRVSEKAKFAAERLARARKNLDALAAEHVLRKHGLPETLAEAAAQLDRR